MDNLGRQVDEWNLIDNSAIRDFVDGGNRLEASVQGVDDELEERYERGELEQPPSGDSDNEERPPAARD